MSNAAEMDVYTRLALIWSDVVWGWVDHLPSSGTLQKILRENFSEEEARVLSEVPLKRVPVEFVTLDEIAARSSFPREKLTEVLDGIAARGLVFAKTTEDGQKAYSVLKGGYGYSQVFYWKGEMTEHARKMAELEREPEYAKARMEMYKMTDTKVYRYIPTMEAIDPQWQNVYPCEAIEEVIERASRFALAQCPCRVRYELLNGHSCGHSKDVCVKLDDLAECLITAGLAREITKEEAIEAMKKADREGMVHFADNAGEQIRHICNCCGDACWNVGPIRRRQVPRDMIMATYFLRETDEDECTGCETCVEICPVAAVQIENDVAKVDLDWCIGCGVCVPRCPSDAIKLVQKENQPIQAVSFTSLHNQVNDERAALKGQSI